MPLNSGSTATTPYCLETCASCRSPSPTPLLQFGRTKNAPLKESFLLPFCYFFLLIFSFPLTKKANSWREPRIITRLSYATMTPFINADFCIPPLSIIHNFLFEARTYCILICSPPHALNFSSKYSGTLLMESALNLFLTAQYGNAVIAHVCGEGANSIKNFVR